MIKTNGGRRLTSKEAARVLGVSEASVKRWADSGLLPMEKTAGGHRRFRPEDVAAARRRVPAAGGGGGAAAPRKEGRAPPARDPDAGTRPRPRGRAGRGDLPRAPRRERRR